MWKMHEIREIINLFDESSLQELEVDLGEAETKISLKKQESALDSYVNIETYKPAAVPAAVKEVLTPAKKEISKPVEQRSSVETKTTKEERQKPIDADDPSLFK